jgi:hypothetical protein
VVAKGAKSDDEAAAREKNEQCGERRGPEKLPFAGRVESSSPHPLGKGQGEGRQAYSISSSDGSKSYDDAYDLCQYGRRSTYLHVVGNDEEFSAVVENRHEDPKSLLDNILKNIMVAVSPFRNSTWNK